MGRCEQVDRPNGQCICGQAIDEAAYQRFFYSSDEYVAILKSKQKNVDTVRAAKTACEADLVRLDARTQQLLVAAAELKSRTEKWAGTDGKYGTELERIDDEILETRLTVERLKQQLDMELERNKLEESTVAAESEVARLNDDVQRSELEARADRARKIVRFDAIYSQLMTQTLAEIRTARLDADYEPVLDQGEYREASATVTRRLMYFLTLLQLSLEDAIPFPRFLLIDTPETAGVDRENLSRAIGKIPEVLNDHAAQVILTTGADRYPKELIRSRVLVLTKASKLLRPKGTASPSESD